MAIAWDAGTAIDSIGDVAPGSPFVRVLLDTIPDYLSASDDDPPRYYRLGVVGGVDGDYRSLGTLLRYTAQEFTVDIPEATGIYWSLEPGVSGTLYRGTGTVSDIEVACVLYRSAAYTTATGVTGAIPFDLERTDPWGMHSAGVNPSRITIPVPGWYSVGAALQWANNNVGYRIARIVRNGATRLVGTNVQTLADAAGFVRQNIARTVWLDAGDYIELQAGQTSGGNLDLQVDGEESIEMWAVRVA